MTIKLKDAIKTFFKNNDIDEKVENNTIFLIWEEIVGTEISKATEIEKIKNNILYIKTINPAWRTEISFQKEKIKNKIIQKLPKMKIKDIRFV